MSLTMYIPMKMWVAVGIEFSTKLGHINVAYKIAWLIRFVVLPDRLR